MTTSTPLIQLTAVTKAYSPPHRPPVQALNEVTLNIQRGELAAIVGASGSGKSTLLNVVGLLDRPSTGTYRLAGEDVSRAGLDMQARLRSDRIGFVFQAYRLLPRASALENVELPLLYSDRAAPANVAKHMLDLVGLSDRAHHRATELSGGQQQRVAIARALVNSPDILLADEPTGNLDPRAALEIVGIFQTLPAQGKTILWVTHDLALARHCQRILTLENGAIVSDEFVAKPNCMESSKAFTAPPDSRLASEAHQP